jgi:glycosyltransferase involved in cell wall biosynthesis
VNADVWHGTHYTLPLRLPIARVVTIHDCTFFDHPEWHQRSKVWFFRRMIRRAVSCAGAIVAVSDHTAVRVRALLAPDAPVFVAPHGVDHERFSPRSDPTDASRIDSIGARPPYVAFAGLIEPRKDVPTLVAAFAKVARTHPDLQLVVAGGDGWGLESVREAVRASGVATRIVRPGYVHDDVLPALFRRAAVVAYPSLEEGFGLPVLEALACGAPVVTTRGTAMEEVAGNAAEVVRAGDAEELATAISSIIDGPGVADRLRTAGPDRAAAFTWSASADRHVEAYATSLGTDR